MTEEENKLSYRNLNGNNQREMEIFNKMDYRPYLLVLIFVLMSISIIIFSKTLEISLGIETKLDRDFWNLLILTSMIVFIPIIICMVVNYLVLNWSEKD